MRRAIVLPVVITMVMLSPGESASAVGSRFLELRGNSSASTLLTLKDKVRLECCRNRIDPNKGAYIQGMTATTTGTYVGFVIERVGHNVPLVGAVRVPQFDLGKLALTLMPLGTERTLPPGKYRIHLLTDGEATVRIAMTGLSHDLVRKPRGPSPVEGGIVDIGHAGSGYATIPVSIAPRTTLAMAAYIRTDLSVAHALSACVGRLTDLCQTRSDRGRVVIWRGVSEAFMQQVYGPGELPVKGATDVSFTAASVGAAQVLQGFALTFR